MTLAERYINAKKVLFDKVYGGLNPRQREAVFTVNGPMLILAGAGSGKTTVLVKRIAYIIKYGNAYHSERIPEGLDEAGVRYYENAERLPVDEIERNILPDFIENPCPPYRMLAITFTNKAANEIKNRLAASFGQGGEELAGDIWAGTFHSVCVKILRRYADRLGYTQSFSIYDTDDSKKAVTAAMKACGVDDKQFPVKSVMNEIGRAKDRILTPELFDTEAASDFRLSRISNVYREYQKHLKASNAMDFDDIIMQTVILLRDNKDIREYYKGKFLYVCVDEYQDTNRAQFELTCCLTGAKQNIMVVGDDDQSIYRFRGATVENILGFDREYKNTKIIKLEQNYRSTQTILDAANVVVSNNKGRKGKTLWTAGEAGEKITMHEAADQNDEARYMADSIYRQVTRYKRHYKDFAVLYRTNAQSRIIEEVFSKCGIPHRLLGGTRFNDREEIRDVTAYLQLINNHSDGERLMRIVGKPSRKIGAKTLEAVAEIADESGISMFEVMEHADRHTALAKSAPQLKNFTDMINRFTALSVSMPLTAFYDTVVTESGYRRLLLDDDKRGQDRLDNVNEFKSTLIEYEDSAENPTLGGFLEEYALVADVDKYDETADAVVLMTIHSAKGLEFPIVYLPGMEDGMFPGMQTICGTPEDMEEERRLAYVALTRAKEKIYILHCRTRTYFGQTSLNPLSRFAGEIPDSLIENERLTDAFGAASKRQPVRTYISNGIVSGGRPAPGLHVEKSTAGKSLPGASGNTDTFRPGDIVTHSVFGRGEVLSAKRMGSDTLYEVVFDKVGTKKLMATYARLKKSQ